MKRLLLILAILVIALSFVPVAYADTTNGADYNYDIGGLGEIINHDHGYVNSNTQRAKRWQVGLGADIIVQEKQEGQNNLFPIQTIVEGKYDIANKNGGVYVVATYRWSDMWKGMIDVRNDIVDIIPGI